jgi:flagellar biosynthesis protein FliR
MTIADVLLQMRAELGFQADFTHILVTMALLLLRILPTIILTPMIGGEASPVEVKLGLGLIIALVIFPGVADRVQYISVDPMVFLVLLLKELFVGYTIAFIVGRVFDAAAAGGQLMDNMSGTNSAQIQVPSIGQAVSLYAALKLQIFITLFLTLNGHHLVIFAIGESFQTIPLESFPKFSHGMWPFFDLMMRVFADLLRVALAISAPVLLATFLTDIALGMINRVAPQVQVFFISMQIKPAVTVLVLFTSLHLILLRGREEFGYMFSVLRKAIWLLG